MSQSPWYSGVWGLAKPTFLWRCFVLENVEGIKWASWMQWQLITVVF